MKTVEVAFSVGDRRRGSITHLVSGPPLGTCLDSVWPTPVGRLSDPPQCRVIRSKPCHVRPTTELSAESGRVARPGTTTQPRTPTPPSRSQVDKRTAWRFAWLELLRVMNGGRGGGQKSLLRRIHRDNNMLCVVQVHTTYMRSSTLSESFCVSTARTGGLYTLSIDLMAPRCIGKSTGGLGCLRTSLCPRASKRLKARTRILRLDLLRWMIRCHALINQATSERSGTPCLVELLVEQRNPSALLTLWRLDGRPAHSIGSSRRGLHKGC